MFVGLETGSRMLKIKTILSGCWDIAWRMWEHSQKTIDGVPSAVLELRIMRLQRPKNYRNSGNSKYELLILNQSLFERIIWI